MSKPNIRIAEQKDAQTIIDFNIRMARETENLELPYDKISEGVLKLLDEPGRGFYIVAEMDGITVGTLMITTEWSDWRNGFFWWIQSVYVIAEYRRKGIYSDMYDFIKTLAANKNDVCGYRLYVEENNIIAQTTYQSLGMSKTHYQLYEELKKNED